MEGVFLFILQNRMFICLFICLYVYVFICFHALFVDLFFPTLRFVFQYCSSVRGFPVSVLFFCCPIFDFKLT